MRLSCLVCTTPSLSSARPDPHPPDSLLESDGGYEEGSEAESVALHPMPPGNPENCTVSRRSARPLERD